MSAPSLAIDLQRVTKIYKRRVRALDGIAMQVRRGEVFGLLGPNGAGKSTLVKIIMSVVRPTEAHGTVMDHPVSSKPSLLHVGYLPEHHRFPRYLTGRQTLEFFAALSTIDRPTAKKRAGELLDTVGMTRWADHKVASYSKGMMQRVGIAAALVNDPHLVILDEPTDGVDPVGRREIRDVLLALKAQGKSVFVNSHLLSELEMISDRVAILVAGRVVKQGTINDLTVGRQYFEIEVAADPDALYSAATNSLFAQWKPPASPPTSPPVHQGTLRTGHAIELRGPALRLLTEDVAALQPVIDALRSADLPIKRITAARPSLEDLFIEAVGGLAGGHEAGASLARQGARP